MKKLFNILYYFVCSLILILSVVMAFLEIRLIVSLDFLLYDNAFNGFVRYFLRTIIALSYLFMVLVVFIKRFRNNDFIKKHFVFLEFGLLVISYILYLTTANYIGLVCFVLMGLYSIFKFLKYKFS